MNDASEIIKAYYPKLYDHHRIVLKRLVDLRENDGEEAYKLMKLTLQIADTWNEAQLNAKKIADLTGEKNATALKDYARHNYNVMLEAHTTSRMVWKYVNDMIPLQ